MLDLPRCVPTMIQPTDIHTLTEFKRNSSELIEKLDDTGRPLALTVDGKAKVVVLGVEAFETLVALADRAETIEAIRKGLEDVKAGRMKTLEQFDRAMRRKFKMRRRA